MKSESAIFSSILQNPASFTLQGNRALVTNASPESMPYKQLDAGHVVVYGPLGRRILMTDPGGHPLHECEWGEHADGTVHLVSARLYLDWGQWVGLKPGGLVNAMNLDLTTRPDWQTLIRDDLRMMASRAMGVAIEEVEFFYADEDLVLDGTGQATIRQRKDAFYVLKDGTWDRAQFMSCMSAMHWATIDYLPVVELFKSLLPGTGSAAFELIRGLYDDQNPQNPRTLQYRGIPTYPSAAAFGLFGNFFTATHRGGENPFAVFMDPPRSHEVNWLPNPHPPVRHVDPQHRMCLTVKQGNVVKVTKTDDASGLPFVPPNQQGFAPCGKRVIVDTGHLFLDDHKASHEIALQPGWSITHQVERQAGEQADSSKETSWEGFFPDGVPAVSPREAYSAVLLYPEDETPIDDLASQPFAADFLSDFVEQDQRLAVQVGQAVHILIHGFDGVIGSLLAFDRPRSTTVVYSRGAYAQKHAQAAWNQLARSNRLDRQESYRFVSEETFHYGASTYDLMYVWLPFASYDDPVVLQDRLRQISKALRPNALAFLAGPDSLPSIVSGLSLDIAFGDLVANLQPFRMHQSILPKATLHPRLSVWIVKKS
ncbi:MAG: hypothetical protein F4090_07510 [Nitrospira sp. SB0672_bin_25]|nr:hypothetical protein [Nitrospira sp. SB0678_bin_10]MYJ54726.1 hypothetical protein [Nitrospira sp. SB0672_bin_25]